METNVKSAGDGVKDSSITALAEPPGIRALRTAAPGATDPTRWAQDSGCGAEYVTGLPQ
jgi:hypothetical protein